MRLLANAAACLPIALTLELEAYSWEISRAMSNSPWQSTFIDYLLAAVIVTLFCSVMPSLLIRSITEHLRLEGSGLRRLAATYATVGGFGIIIIVLLFSGLGLFLNIPGTRVVSFFSEFQFLIFAFQVGVPVCLVAAGIYTLGIWAERKSGDPSLGRTTEGELEPH